MVVAMTDQTIPLGRARFPTGRIARLRTRSRARTDQPSWVRPALVAVLALAADLCLWNLTISGTSNE
jgi:hypothetical protein